MNQFMLAKVKDPAVAEHSSGAGTLFDVVATVQMKHTADTDKAKVQTSHAATLAFSNDSVICFRNDFWSFL